MDKKKILKADRTAMKALRGFLAEIPEGLTVADVLAEFKTIGGIEIKDPKKLEKQALQYSEGAKISHIIVNRVMGDMHIAMLIDDPEYPATREAVVSDQGFLAYVYNHSAPWCSELGYIFLEEGSDGNIHRVG